VIEICRLGTLNLREISGFIGTIYSLRGRESNDPNGRFSTADAHNERPLFRPD